ncbi:MAG: hypothetical protein II956_15085 [Bacteroidales bacterium]|nr:hypothetical protein [Bacteroidales bacterium]
MASYPKWYLDEIVETQGKLFEYVADFSPEINVDDFIEKYMSGSTRKFIDKADAYLSNMDEKDLYDYFCKHENFHAKKGKGFPGFAPNWIGQFYAYYQWKTGLSSSEVIKKLPLDFMKAAYHGLHDLDLNLAVKKVITAMKK